MPARDDRYRVKMDARTGKWVNQYGESTWTAADLARAMDIDRERLEREKALRAERDATPRAAEVDDDLGFDVDPPSPVRPARAVRFDGKTMPWGKYRGQPLDAVPLGYIGWIWDRQLSGESALQPELADALLCSVLSRLAGALPVYRDALRRLVDTQPKQPKPSRTIARRGEEI